MTAKSSDTNIGDDRMANQVPPPTPFYRSGRFFFVVAAIFFLIVALAGFVDSYQNLEKRKFQLHWFAHVHGVLMAGWLLVFLTQAILVANGRLRIHRRLGQFSVVLGILVWISMGVLSYLVLSMHNPPVDHFLFDVLIIQVYLMMLFGLVFGWGILLRKKAAPHKRLLLLATLILIQAAIDRIHWLPWLHDGLSIRFFYMDAFFISLFIYDLITLKRIHKIAWIGASTVVAAQVLWSSSGALKSGTHSGLT
jgi:hypothetical protein